MNPSAILGLLADLYGQVLALQERVRELEARLGELDKPSTDR